MKHPLTTPCFDTHGSDLHLCFSEVFTRQVWKGRIGRPWMWSCEVLCFLEVI